jgi:hypothetical protein
MKMKRHMNGQRFFLRAFMDTVWALGGLVVALAVATRGIDAVISLVIITLIVGLITSAARRAWRVVGRVAYLR